MKQLEKVRYMFDGDYTYIYLDLDEVSEIKPTKSDWLVVMKNGNSYWVHPSDAHTVVSILTDDWTNYDQS